MNSSSSYYTIVDNGLYGTVTFLALANLVVVILLRQSLGISQKHASLFILGAFSWLLFNVFTIPWISSYLIPPTAWLNSAKGETFYYYITFVSDEAFFLTLFLYQLASMFRLRCLEDISREKRFYFSIVMIASAILYGVAFFVLNPLMCWCVETDCGNLATLQFFMYSIYYNLCVVFFTTSDLFMSCLSLKFIWEKILMNRRSMNLIKNLSTEDQRILTKRTKILLAIWCCCWLVPIFVLISVSTMTRDITATYFILPNILSDATQIPLTIEFFLSVYFLVILKDWISLSNKGYVQSSRLSLQRQALNNLRRESLVEGSSRRRASIQINEDCDKDANAFIENASDSQVSSKKSSRVSQMKRASVLAAVGEDTEQSSRREAIHFDSSL